MPSQLLTIKAHPILKGLAEHLVDGAVVVQKEVNLESTLVVLPTQRARRLFEHYLLDAAEQQEVLVVPPEITTPGRMADLFVPPTGIPANAVTLGLVDAQVWSELPEHSRALVEGESATESSRESLIQRLGRLHHECCLALVDFSRVRDEIPEGLSGGQEREVWDVLVSWQEARQQKLDALQMQCPATEQSRAIRAASIEPGAVERVILVDGDSLHSRTALLEVLDQKGVDIDRVVPQEGSAAPMHPISGGAVSDWSDADLKFDDANLHVADGPEDQAQLVAGLIQKSGCQTTSEVTLVCPDPDMEAAVQSVLPSYEVPIRTASAGALLDGALGRMLSSVQKVLQGGWAEVEALLRVPGFLDMCHLESKVIDKVDQCRREHLGVHLHDERMKDSEEVRDVLAAIETVLGPIKAASGHQAIDEIVKLAELGLRQNLPERTRDDLEESAVALRKVLDQFQAAPDDLLGLLSGTEVLKLVLQELDQLVLTPDAEDDSVEVVGWLEAAWDPAPLRIVLGMNENLIPSRPILEPLVPDSIRERLGLDSQARRAARDAWLVDVLESSRSHSAKVEYIVPRQNVDGDRLLPSRLVLPRVESTLERLPRLLSSSCDLQMRPRRAPRREASDGQGAPFPLLPAALPELKRVSVTDFRVWLDSPVKFVLKKMKLAETVDPWRSELDAMRFGNLVHSAFEAWGREEAANGPTTTLKAIQEGFQHHLESCVNERFGKARPAALKLQIEIARHRMQAFAEVQHRLAQEEWCVEHVELHFTDRDVPNAIDPLRRTAAPDLIVTGKIDRVDRHPSGKRRAIDYKVVNSSDLSKKRAEASHYQVRKRNWIDLQLPVYRTRLQALEEGNVEVALALLPHQVSKTEIDVAGWDDAMFASAEETMDNILKRIGEFPNRPLEGAELDNPGGFGADRFDVLWGDGLRGTDSNGSVSEGGDQ